MDVSYFEDKIIQKGFEHNGESMKKKFEWGYILILTHEDGAIIQCVGHPDDEARSRRNVPQNCLDILLGYIDHIINMYG